MDETDKMVLSAPQGFTYSGYQMVIARLNKVNISHAVADIWNANANSLTSAIYKTEAFVKGVFNGHGCFMVLSGESFTLQDLAVALDDVIGIEIICKGEGV